MLKVGRPTEAEVAASLNGTDWPVLAECPAPRHNTLYAARGRTTRKAVRPRCICPRSRELLDAENARHRERTAARHRVTPLKHERVTLRVWPDLSGGLCQSMYGVRLFDRARDPDKPADRQEAMATCEQCPVRNACVTTLKVEYPAGSWGGVIAGFNADQRRRLAGLHP